MPASRRVGDATRSVHGGERRPGPEGSIVFPIYQSTVYATKPGTDDPDDIDYIRLSNTPSQAYLHDKLAALEGAEAAVATASGMSAMTTILATYLQSGDHMIAAEGL
ncbi:MAG TPA: PLP-dependent transferase, partial [Actinomycetota bacterium]|nr:PLP-dependent transferase [Actinomycetota bacterium]